MISTPPASVNEAASDAPVLVVDADGVSRRFVELSLGRGGVALEFAKDGAGAIEILRTTRAGLILADTELPDMAGLQLFRHIDRERRLRHVPFVFFTADTRLATKVAALRAGVEDYLTKPIDPTELLERLRAILRRRQRTLQVVRQRSYALAGDFQTVAFADLLSILELGRRSGKLVVMTGHATGEVVFDEGRLVRVSFGNLPGKEAFYRLMTEADGQFEFAAKTSSAPPPADAEFSVSESITGLIMEAARRQDESARLPQGAPAPRIATLPEVTPPQGAAPPSYAVVRHYEQAAADPFNLGELMLWTAEDLARWTDGPSGERRVHVHLVADLGAGVTALLSMGAPPSERWVLEALNPVAKTAGMAFHLRHDRLLDLVLLDVRHPNALRRSLHRSPEILILAPPEGDALAVGPQARIDLIESLRERTPSAVVGVGNTSVDRLLDTQSKTVPFRWRALRHTLGDGTDFRGVLVEAIRLWGSDGERPASRQVG